MANEQKKPSSDVVMWVRLPRATSIQELKKLGLQGAACFGGDTCIAATSMRSNAGIVIQQDLEKLLSEVGLVARDPCFGGDTCIV
jgi:hypothetical protein